MAELTLESLAARVEALEKLLGSGYTYTHGKYTFVIRPGTGDRAAALAGLDEITDYDFGANEDMNALELRLARGEQP